MLIIAGEVIFFLPFVIPRVFRPTFLAVFDITNFELGTFFSVYGVIAIFAYLFGGPLADRFPPHGLMSVALFSTALGGIFLATVPDVSGMFYVYGFWGLTTIFLFWASLMRTTRLIGGEDRQGISFGLLDGGRGLVAAIIGLIAVWILSKLLPVDVQSANIIERREAFQKVILFFCAIVFLTSLLIFWILRRISIAKDLSSNRISWNNITRVALLPAVWLQALIILSAYSGYRVADDISLLARDVLNYDEVQAAGIGSLSLWLRPLAAISAGFLADRISSSRMIMVSFALMFIGGLAIVFGPSSTYLGAAVFIGIVSTSLGVFAMRGLYFAIMQEGEIPVNFTGTAVGIASIVGYLPDIYMAPLMGIFLDKYPGIEGHRYVFMMLMGFATLGFIATLIF
ncbi:MAG: MFS transporter, partial [Flavobacteriales bacterium]|nr:MFS transporter [Flavobacteriales bacterium]